MSIKKQYFTELGTEALIRVIINNEDHTKMTNNLLTLRKLYEARQKNKKVTLDSKMRIRKWS